MTVETDYNFSIATDTANGRVNSDSLALEIQQCLAIGKGLLGLSTNGDDLLVTFKDALTADELIALGIVVTDHAGVAIDKLPVSFVKIVDETVPTQGYYQTSSVVVEITQSGLNYLDHSFPFDISLYGAHYHVIDGEVGDYIECIVAPDTIVGYITSATSGAVIEVSDTVLANSALGFYANLLDGTNGNSYELGRIIEKDTANGKITVEVAPPANLDPAGPVYVRINAKLVCHQVLPTIGSVTLGRTLKGGSHIPKNTTIRFLYHDANGNSSGKAFIAVLEYFY